MKVQYFFASTAVVFSLLVFGLGDSVLFFFVFDSLEVDLDLLLVRFLMLRIRGSSLPMLSKSRALRTLSRPLCIRVAVIS